MLIMDIILATSSNKATAIFYEFTRMLSIDLTQKVLLLRLEQHSAVSELCPFFISIILVLVHGDRKSD